MLFGAVVGSVIGCLWNSVHSPEHELLEQLCAFRDCGKICHRLLVEFRPQPRKRAFGASNSLLFGAVAGSVIGCLWNSVHSPENELLEQLCPFRGCGEICHWLLVEFRPQPRKQAFAAIVCFSGLWQDLSLAACGIPATAPKTSFWTNFLLFGAVVGSVIGCLDLSLAACGIPSTAPKTSFWSNCVLFGAVVGSVIGCLWNSVHSPENDLLEQQLQLCAFRSCGRICHWLLVEFRPQPRKRSFGTIVCFSELW